MKLTMDHLSNCINNAIYAGAKYIGVLIELPDTNGTEIIINDNDNFTYKLNYYRKTYNEDLSHRHVPNLKIVGFTFGDSFKEIEEDLVGGFC